MFSWMRGVEILAAIALDLLLGDPESYPHPVRIMGRCARGLARELRPRIINQRIAGIVTAAVIVVATFVTAWLVIGLVGQVSETLGTLVRVFLLYTTISIRDLGHEARSVQRRLLAGDLPAARRRLARIVGRDTLHLDQAGVTRAAVESVAESTVDGVISPLFYAFLGGAPLALAFKAASTLDSMFGYRTPALRDFGWASARLDDAANFIPARLAAAAIPLAALTTGRRWLRAFVIALRDRGKHDSPNAGIPEAAFAGALGIALGGPSRYGGALLQRPVLGSRLRELRVEDISVACSLSLASALAFALPVAAFIIALSLASSPAR